MANSDIVGRIRIDASGVSPGFAQATSAVNKFAGDIKRTLAGAFGGAAFVAAVRRTIEQIDQIGDVSQQLGLPVEQVQALQNAANDASDSFEKLLSILTKIQDVQLDIVKGDTPTGLKNRQLLQKHGFSVNQINNMSMIQFAQVIAKSIKDTAELNQLLGPKMSGKFNVYRSTISNIDENTASGLKTGRIKSQAELDEIDQTIQQGKAIWDSLWKEIFYSLSSLAMVFKNLYDWIVSKIPKSWLEASADDKSIWGGISRALKATSGFGGAKEINRMFREMRAKEAGIDPNASTNIPSGPLLPPDQLGGGGKIYSDSLVGVGNFLGQNSSVMNSAADVLLKEVQKQNEILKKIEENTAQQQNNPLDGWRRVPYLGWGWEE